MADQVEVSGGVPGPAIMPSDQGKTHQFGLTTATALIVGSIIGAGIFNLPSSLASSSGTTAFTTLVVVSGITAAIPYGFSALAQLKWRWIDHKTVQTPRFVREMIIAALSLVFSILFIWYSRNTGNSIWVYWAPFFLAAAAMLLGIPVYLAQRRHLTEPPAVPPYR